jgi:hypothetical protein
MYIQKPRLTCTRNQTNANKLATRMKINQPISGQSSTASKFSVYTKLSKSILSKPFKQPQHLLPLGAAFLAGMPVADAQIVYSGAQNVACALAGNTNRCYANINGAGGNDLEIHRNHAFGNQFIQIDEVVGGGFAINGFHAKVQGTYVYPYANVSGVNIGPGGPWGFQAGQANSLSEINNAYPNDAWTPLGSGTTRFIGIRGLVGGQTKYGWVRLTKNGFGNHTIVDWAFNSTTNGTIITGQTAPIEMVAFDYQVKGNDVQLNWRTSSEVNNAGFHIERSEDGRNFSPIAWVDGSGSTTESKDYYYDDKDLRTGKTYYYRLRQVDIDGTFELSPVISTTLFGNGPVVGEFFPNPAAAGNVALSFAAKRDGQLTATLFDGAGKEIQKNIMDLTEGLNDLTFDYSKLRAGVYFVKLENGYEKVYRRLAIQ